MRSRWASLVNRVGVKIGYPDRAVQDRKLLFYQSEPLAHAAEVTGHPIVTLHVRSTASDGLFIVYLEDITVAGEVLYVTEGVLRVLHRLTRKEDPTYRLPDGVPYRTFTRADGRPLALGELAVLVFDLQPVSYLFRPGHSIRIAIAGADQDNFEFVPAASPPWIEILRDRSHPSHIALPIASTNPPIK
jgi:hypothetical protein